MADEEAWWWLGKYIYICVCVYIYIYMNRYIFVYIHIAPLWLLRAAAAREPSRGNEAFFYSLRAAESQLYCACLRAQHEACLRAAQSEWSITRPAKGESLAYGQSMKLAGGQLKANALAYGQSIKLAYGQLKANALAYGQSIKLAYGQLKANALAYGQSNS